MAKYKWVAESNDGWDDESTQTFSEKKDAYNDMRSAVLSKMTWNTEFDEDLAEYEEVTYEVIFRQDKIVHKSYSGIYTYQIVECE